MNYQHLELKNEVTNIIKGAFNVAPINDEVLFEEERVALKTITTGFLEEAKISEVSLEKQCRLILEAIRVLNDNGKRIQIYYTQELNITKDRASLLAKRGRLFLWADTQENGKEIIKYISALSDANIKFITRARFKDNLISVLYTRPKQTDIRKLYPEEKENNTKNKKNNKKKSSYNKVNFPPTEFPLSTAQQKIFEHKIEIEKRLNYLQEGLND